MLPITENQLAELLLDKNLLNVSFEPEEEDCSPEYMERQMGYAPGFASAVRNIRKKSRDWGWCVVNCTGRIGGLEATNYLGGCSYKSREDFIKNSGYADDMKQTVALEIAGQLLPMLNVFVPLINELTA